MAKTFKHIALFGRVRNRPIADTLKALLKHLKNKDLSICLDEETARHIGESTVPTVSHDKLGENCDLLIVVGGDGSILQAAHAAVEHNTPILGINRGRLGFLADIKPTQLEEKVDEVLSGQYVEVTRFLLDSSIQHKDKTTFIGVGLNDVVLHPGDLAHMIEFTIYVNDQLLFTQRADGLIVATPTGSTAYALSGGGPILHPRLDAITLVPMFPHTLSSRPIVINGESKISIKIEESNETSPRISCDGQKHMPVAPGDTLHIHKKRELLRLIHPEDYNYFETLRSKLGWQV